MLGYFLKKKQDICHGSSKNLVVLLSVNYLDVIVLNPQTATSSVISPPFTKPQPPLSP